MPRAVASPNSRWRSSRWRASASARSSPPPERISISLEMSSPGMPSESSGSPASAASRSSSKRGTRSSVCMSRSANSSSIPTVKSVAAAKNSAARSASIVMSGEIEVERVEQVHGGARGMDRHLGGNLQQRVRVVEDDLHAGVDELVGQRLRRGRRHREHADDDVLLLDDLAQVVDRPDRLGAHRLADLRGVVVEDRDDAEPGVGEDVARGDRLAEVAGAEQRDVVLAGGAQDLADLRDERVDVVADAALAELAEAGQVAADLRRVDVRVVAELLGGDRLLAHLLGLREHLQVAREACGDAERQALGTGRAVAGAGRDGGGDVTQAHRRPTLARRARRSPSSTWYSYTSSPSTDTTGMRS